jgi:hypothetical protein
MNHLDLQDSVLRALPRLALGMLHKLSIHAGKGPWENVPLENLLHKFDEEVGELRAAIRAREPYHRVLDEAADVANMVMLLADYVARNEMRWQLQAPAMQSHPFEWDPNCLDSCFKCGEGKLYHPCL